MLELNKIYNMDCIEGMKMIEDKSIDMILCDLPYGTTQNRWDSVIPFELLWQQYLRIIKDKRAIVLFSSQPFTTDLINSNRKWFKYELIWDKTFGRQPQLANIQPMKRHENVLVFGQGKLKYNPQRVPLDKPYKSSGAGNNAGTENNHKLGLKKIPKVYTHKTPDTMLSFKPDSNSKIIHPTQKPVALLEWLIKSYSNEGDLILDNCMGSASTAIACINTNRKYIGFELDLKYWEISQERIQNIV